MARKTETKNIGGLEYKATALGAREGAEGLRRIAAKIAAALGAVRSADRAAGSEMAVIAGVAASLSSEDLTWFCGAFGRVTTVEMSPGTNKRPLVDAVFDELFAGEYESMLEFLQMNLELNYAGVFSAALAKMGASAPKSPAA